MVFPGDERLERDTIGERAAPDQRTVVGAFDRVDAAERAVAELRAAGIDRDRVTVTERGTDAADEIPSQAASERGGNRAPVGALVGAAVFGLIGFLLGTGTVVVPGLEPFLAYGWLATTIGAAVVGAGAGFWVGSLMSVAVPEDVARRYSTQSRQGRYLVMVRTDDDDVEQTARRTLEAAGSRDVEIYPYGARPDRFPGARPGAPGAAEHHSGVHD